MSDITACPTCKADLNVSTAPGEQFVCSRCGYTAAKPLPPPSVDRDLDVKRSGWRAVHPVLLVLILIVVVPIVIFLVGCGVVWLGVYLTMR